MKSRTTSRKTKTRTIVLLGFEGAAALDITGPHDVFALSSRLAQGDSVPPYQLVVLADRAGPFRATSGLSLVADGSWRDFHGQADTLLVAGGPDMAHVLGNRRLLAWLRAMSGRTRRIGSICTGAFALAEAGLLESRRATTHWMDVERLAKEYPKVTVEPDAIYVKDRNIFTSAGITAGMDLALALVEEDLGREAALAVARMLVLYLKRPGGQSQFSTRLQAQATEGRRLTSLLSWLADHYQEPITVEAMASRAAMSERTFARVFVLETGDTPAYYLEKLRLEHAARLLETSGISLDVAARDCGFTGREQLRRTFQRHRGITPQDYHKRFRTTGANTKDG
ncbi:MAG: GlxA family transcriptional regulator [Nitrospira sp.]|nr:MAG: GlxA family transcriptional regulator [Nitrospira sp.]